MTITKTNTSEELTRLSDVIGLIYEGATDPSRWTKEIVPALAEYLEAPACILFTPLHPPQSGGFSFMQGISQDHIDLYAQKYHVHDIYLQTALKKNLWVEGNVLLSQDVLSDAELSSSVVYKEYMSLSPNMGRMMSSIVFGLESTQVMPAACTYHRGLDRAHFGEVERHRQHLLLPHISRSLAVMQRLRSAELTVATTLAALDRLPSGVLLLNGAGHVAFANRAAQHMLEQGDGLYLRQNQSISGLGRLDTDSAAIANAIDAAILVSLRRDLYGTQHFSKSVSVPRPSGFGSYTLQFSALGNLNEFGGGASGYQAIVFVADSAQKPNIDPKVLQDTYRLTPAEAAAAITLLEHDSVKGAARALGNSPSTVQSQLKQIYLKLSVDSRTRFVKVMLGLASPKS